MELGRCSSCTRPYTASEIAGYGILRPRPEAAGGPILELACPGCGRIQKLVPHGDGRYARPGEPPPPAVPEAERRPPWASGSPPPRPPRAPAPPRPTEPRVPRVEIPAPEPEPEPPPPPALDEPLTVSEALEVLGIGAGASDQDVDRAFRERSRTCHPDKVAHLDPEFQELAERKFKRLKAAYDMLRG